jgi:hypothetical protein
MSKRARRFFFSLHQSRGGPVDFWDEKGPFFNQLGRPEVNVKAGPSIFSSKGRFL